jgi:hypothetical protein
MNEDALKLSTNHTLKALLHFLTLDVETKEKVLEKLSSIYPPTCYLDDNRKRVESVPSLRPTPDACLGKIVGTLADCCRFVLSSSDDPDATLKPHEGLKRAIQTLYVISHLMEHTTDSVLFERDGRDADVWSVLSHLAREVLFALGETSKPSIDTNELLEIILE